MTDRLDMQILELFCILRGQMSKGVTVFGPFETHQEATAYGDKNFLDDTWEVTPIRREIIVHGED